MNHYTDQAIAFSKQIPFDVPPDPSVVPGGVVIVGREYVGPSVATVSISHHVPIVQKRDESDMDKLRKMLAGLVQRPKQATPNAEYHAMRQALSRPVKSR